MAHTHWHKQTKDEPLFPNLLWSQPEHKAQAGKLGVIGGNAHGFSAAAEAYAEALKAGTGSARGLLPASLQKTVGRVFEAGEYAPSNPSGSFSQPALGDMLELSLWADGLLIAGDLGHNSETAIVLEKLAHDYSGQLTLVDDALDYFINNPDKLLSRRETLLVPNFAQLQKLAASAKFPEAFTSSMGLVSFVANLHTFTTKHLPYIATFFDDNIVIAVDGKISTTKHTEVSLIKLAAQTSTWWLQNPSKPFEALSTSIVSDTK